MNRFLLCITVLLLFSTQTHAGKADVLSANVNCNTDSICNFSVTVQHADQGWEHYANRWEIMDIDGQVLGVRELAHPHEYEQPFTRSLSGVKVPDGVSKVIIRANDSVHGLGGKELIVDLNR